MASGKKEFQLEVPLDASGIEGFTPGQPVKVVIRKKNGELDEKTVELGKDGKGTAKFSYDANPGPIQILAGPGDATGEEICGLQTIAIPAKEYEPADRVVTVPIRIPPYYWHWWLIWCRKFVIRGKVTCPDGSAVPGAKVCAYDVDFFWWWRSTQKIACATTDQNGSFEMTFRWCCGWWPWYWWRKRFWHLEPLLSERILRLLKSKKFRKMPVPGPTPEIQVFDDLLAEAGTAISVSDEKSRTLGMTKKPVRSLTDPALITADEKFNPAVFEKYRAPVQELLPFPPELDRFEIWPWCIWLPWWDCTPDVIFRVTQQCNNTTNVIVEETISNTRWNIPQVLNVNLQANDKACCVDMTPPPGKNCVNITGVCSTVASEIGGNYGSAVSVTSDLAGFAFPGYATRASDRPFAGNLPVSGDFGIGTGADYYELEYYRDGDGGAWKAMPVGAVAGFSRVFFGPSLSGPAGMPDSHYASFPVVTIEEEGTTVKHDVIESRQHFEANNGAGSWESLAPGSRWWTGNKTLLAYLVSTSLPGDGRYHFRVKSWTLSAAGKLKNPKVLPQCGTDQTDDIPDDNRLVLVIDNRDITGSDGHPAGHPCGTGMVHACTLEPDTDIVDVRIFHPDGSSEKVGPCGNLTITKNDVVQIDLYAYDKDSHLMYYTLQSTWKKNLTANILAAAQSVTGHPFPATCPSLEYGIAPLPASASGELPSGIPCADFAGPDYLTAVTPVLPPTIPPTPHATRPLWHCGGVRVVAPAIAVFPETCCYKLELRAYKRTIAGCQYDERVGHANLTEYSLGIRVA